MDLHHIHDEKIGIHSGAKGVEHWLEHGLTKDGLKKFQTRAERGEEVYFTDGDGNKFKMEHDEATGFHVDKRNY